MITERTCSIAAKANAIAASSATSEAREIVSPEKPKSRRIAAREASALKVACIPTASM